MKIESLQKHPFEVGGWYLFLKYIHNKIHKLQFNWNMIFTGDTGSGKTWAALLMAWQLNKKRFNSTFYTNSIAEFLEIVKSPKTRKGDTVVMDETGANLSSREWHSISNILTGQALQTYRNKNLAVFFCTPDASFVDVQLRRLVNCHATLSRYNINSSYMDVRRVRVDRRNQKESWPQFKFKWNSKDYQVSRIKFERSIFKRIPKKIMDEIKVKDDEFKEEVLRKAEMDAREVEQARVGINRTLKEIAKEVSDVKEKYFHSDPRYKNKIDWKLVAADFKLSRDKAQTILSLVRRGVV